MHNRFLTLQLKNVQWLEPWGFAPRPLEPALLAGQSRVAKAGQ
jgi:hypothetical protein